MSTTSNNSGTPDPNALVAASKSNTGEGRTEPFTHKCTDGRVVVVREGKGKDAVEATRLCSGDQSIWIPALLSILGTIDGEPAFIDTWLDLPLKDYMAIASEVGGNFI